MKGVFLTSLEHSEDKVKDIIPQLRRYGLDVKGHFWEDDLEKMGWSKPRGELISSDIAMWLVFATKQTLSTPSIRYGLSLLSIMVQAHRGLYFPTVLLLEEGVSESPDTLPTPLKGFDFLSASDPAFGAKLVAKVHASQKQADKGYRLDVYANPHIGQWFEIGPGNGSWQGVMLGVSGAQITHQAVGPKGRLPEKTVLNYPIKGMKIELNDMEYTAWAVQNNVDAQTSYFAKVQGSPDSILFGPYSSKEKAEVYVIKLK